MSQELYTVYISPCFILLHFIVSKSSQYRIVCREAFQQATGIPLNSHWIFKEKQRRHTVPNNNLIYKTGPLTLWADAVVIRQSCTCPVPYTVTGSVFMRRFRLVLEQCILSFPLHRYKSKHEHYRPSPLRRPVCTSSKFSAVCPATPSSSPTVVPLLANNYI